MRGEIPPFAFLLACSLLACNSLIGIDGDYTPLGEGGAGDGGACSTADDCSAPTTPCRVAACEDEVCVEELAPEGADCDAGAGHTCTADGECAECIDDDDCPGAQKCNDDECGMP